MLTSPKRILSPHFSTSSPNLLSPKVVGSRQFYPGQPPSPTPKSATKLSAVHAPQIQRQRSEPQLLLSPTRKPPASAPPPFFDKRDSEIAIKREWDESTRRWNESRVVVNLETTHFASGALRYAYRMTDVTQPSKRVSLVAKFAKDPQESIEGYMSDVQMQMLAKSWAEKFNAKGVPKKVDFISAFILQLIERPGKPVCAVEEFVEGDYVRYNNNWDWSDEERNTPQAFSHFTYEESNHNLLICDLQGVGDIWTDPQVHTRDGKLGKGNKGLQGFARFFSAHSCNSICHFLQLAMVGGSKRPKDVLKGTPPPQSWILKHAPSRACSATNSVDPVPSPSPTAGHKTDPWSSSSSDDDLYFSSKQKSNGFKDEPPVGLSVERNTPRRNSLSEQVREWEEQDQDGHRDSDSDSEETTTEQKTGGFGIKILSLDDDLSAAGTSSRISSPGKIGSAMSPTLAGVGMRLEGSPLTGYNVAMLVPGGPAAKSLEINIGDTLLSVDGVSLKFLSLDDVKNLIVGPEGSKITLFFSNRNGARFETKTVVLARGHAVLRGIMAC